MNKIKSIIIMALLVASVIVVISPVSAATYNVYPGNDIVAIIGAASSGDTIYVHAGTYSPTGEINVYADNISIIGDSPSNTIINVYTNDGIGSIYDHLTIKNITVKNASGDGIDIGDYGTIENCVAYGSGDNGFETDTHCTLKNCLSYNSQNNGFYDDSFCTYINCTAVNNGNDGFADIHGGTKVINCIAFENDSDGFDIDNNSGTGYLCEITYSNAWNNNGDDYDETPAGTGSISVDPKFVDGVNTFYLSPVSPCVDRGSESSIALGLYSGFTTRTDGKWDVKRVDMGFHYPSSGGPPSGLPISQILKILGLYPKE